MQPCISASDTTGWCDTLGCTYHKPVSPARITDATLKIFEDRRVVEKPQHRQLLRFVRHDTDKTLEGITQTGQLPSDALHVFGIMPAVL
jgi:hypothetical protein